jgi:hypothetical protein
MKSKFYIALASALISSFSFAQALKVNEIMATNNTYLSDLNNYGDWVEIYNPSNQEVDIAGYYVTDDYTLPTKYQIPTGNPSSIIAPGGYKIIWADDSTQNLHANFKISSNGERFALVASDGVTFIDSISFGPQTTDVSYGRTSDGSDSWTFFTTSSPNASNAPAGISNVEMSNSNNFAFPNPANEFLTVSAPKFETGTVISIYSIEGRLVKQEKIEAISTVIAINNLASGLYVVQLNNGKASVSKRLVVE